MNENKEEIQDIDEITVNTKEEDVFFKHDYVTKLPSQSELTFDIVANFNGLLKEKDVVFEPVLMQLEIQKRLLSNFLEDSLELKNNLLTRVQRIETFEEMKDDDKGIEYVEDEVVKRKPTHYSKIITDNNEFLISIQIADEIFRFKDNLIKEISHSEGDKIYKFFQFDFDKINEILDKGNNLSLIVNIKNTFLEINNQFKLYFDKARSISYITVANEFYKDLIDSKEVYNEIMSQRKADKIITSGLRKRISERYEKRDEYTKRDILSIQDGITKLCSLFNIAYHYVFTYKQTEVESINLTVFDDTKVDALVEDKLNYFLVKCISHHLTKYPQDIGDIIYDTRFDNMKDCLLSLSFKKMVTFFLSI